MYTGIKVSTFRERFSILFSESEKTVMELAKELHVSYQTVSAWKIGTRSPKAPTVIAIASYFKVNPKWLLGFDVEKEYDEVEHRTIPIVVPDSERFVKLVRYMPTSDYVMVMEAFERAEQKMRQAETNGEVQT